MTVCNILMPWMLSLRIFLKDEYQFLSVHSLLMLWCLTCGAFHRGQSFHHLGGQYLFFAREQLFRQCRSVQAAQSTDPREKARMALLMWA
jgi:hypothetical protein